MLEHHRKPTQPRRQSRPLDRHPPRRWLEQLALSPEVDRGKFDRLIAHQEDLDRSRTRASFVEAFRQLQSVLPILDENGAIHDAKGKLQYSYALWEDLNEVVKPLLVGHGFSLWFRTSNERDYVEVHAVLAHVGGHSEETKMRLPMDFSGAKNGAQAVGSSTSYAKRYAAMALLNLTSRGEDDDGRGATAVPSISALQVAMLQEELQNAGRNEFRLAAYFGVEHLDDLPADKFDRALDAIRAKGDVA